jgi:plastocyanin
VSGVTRVPRGRASLSGLLALIALALLLAGCANRTGLRRSDASVVPTSPAVLEGRVATNGCAPGTAVADAQDPVTGLVEIAFGGGTGDRYRPRCVVIEVGGAVRFAGDFGVHPFTGGAVIDGAPVRDPLSALPYTSAGTEATFRADRRGVYPYYCQVHWVLGMSGVIYVE